MTNGRGRDLARRLAEICAIDDDADRRAAASERFAGLATRELTGGVGYTIVAALLDELAFWPTDDSAQPDEGHGPRHPPPRGWRLAQRGPRRPVLPPHASQYPSSWSGSISVV